MIAEIRALQSQVGFTGNPPPKGPQTAVPGKRKPSKWGVRPEIRRVALIMAEGAKGRGECPDLSMLHALRISTKQITLKKISRHQQIEG